MDRDPQSRLGSSYRDAEDIKLHSFFKMLDWNKVLHKEYPIPLPEPRKLDLSIDFSRSIFKELEKTVVKNPLIEESKRDI